MQAKLLLTGFFLTTSLSLAAQNSSVPTAALVNRLVTTVAHVKAGETVILKGDKSQLDLMDALGEQIHQKGAYPVIMLQSERLAKAAMLSVPEADLLAHHKAIHKLDNKADLTIYFSSNIDYNAINQQVPEAYGEKRRQAMQAFHNGVPENMATFREVYVMLPNQKDAASEGIAYATYEKMILAAMAADYEVMAAKGKQLGALLLTGKQVKVTNPNGTNFSFALAGRPFSINDGVISEADLKSSLEIDRQVSLPTGMLFVSGDESSGKGKIVAVRDRQYGNQGQVKLTNAAYTFENGKVAQATATTNQAFLDKKLKVAEPMATQFGGLMIGLNPALKVLSDTQQDFRPYEAEGMVYIQLGGNDWMGGANKVKDGFALPIENATVTVDGKIILKDGKLVLNSVASVK
ncbi:hypothetical protein AAE02nite_43500 [Adhaeribacter aerolatus]|uniref:Aminopeptidase n=1 Tax=Adhaeribacter aerolatus TaxID=670289 RepID=A0A512B3Z2_9BACT|nr:aminopeptidase [Adhaeribacter aerolatus]GEO06686.1 hypothetical protein AAE02nite_43500 [Adhaeribacter aerolatus]